MVLLVGIGAILGLSFFAIKLTLYYMPFYYAGFLYGQFDDRMKESDTGKKVIDSIVAICFAVWLFVILRFSLYEMSDGGFAIILRAATSLAGCIAVCGLCKGIFSSKIGEGTLAWVGEHSLEVYLTHYLLLSLIKLDKVPILYSPVGLSMVLVNYLITVALTAMAIVMITQNAVLRFVLTGKKQ